MSWLLDTDCLSSTSPVAASGTDRFRRWLADNGERLYLSVVSLAEIAYGIGRLQQRGATRKAALLSAWRDDVLMLHHERVLSVDADIATRAGHLLAAAETKGVQPGFEDALIAATAARHGLTVMTRNLRHFRPMTATCVDPAQFDPT